MSARILIIDDDDGVRLTVEHILSSSGYKVAAASSGKQALGLLEEFEPELVITDLIMPEVSGIEIIQKIKQIRPDLKIIAMSGGARLGNSDILHKAQEVGADSVIAKPFEFTQLKILVEHSLAA